MKHEPLGFYGRLATWVMLHRRLAGGVIAVLTLLTGLFALRLRVDSDILSLMPEDDASTKALRRLDEEEGGVNVLTIAVQSKDEAARTAFLEGLDARISALPDVDYVLWRVDDDLAYRLGLLQLSPDDLALIRDRVRGALSLGSAIANPFVAARVLDLGPLTDKLNTERGGLELVNKDGVARMMVRPKGSAHDIPFSKAFMEEIYKILDEADAKSHGVEVKWIGGAYRHNVEDYEAIVKDITTTVSGSFIMVLVIIAAAFRAPRAVFFIFAPLMVSNVWTLGIAALTVGSLNSFTSFTNAVIIGLGVEFGVHLYARTRELLDSGETVHDAVVKSWDLVGGACTSAAFTSSAGFMALLAAHFAGFRQLGWLLALGLLLTLVAEIVLMPILVVVFEPQSPKLTEEHHHARKIAARRLPSWYQMASPVLMVVAALTVVCGLMIRDIRFEYDLSQLRRAGLAYADLDEVQRELVQQSYAPMVASFDTEEELTATHERITADIAAGHLPEIKQVVSIRSVIPADQEGRLAILREIATMAADPNVAFLPAQVQQNLVRVAKTPLTPVTAADLPRSVQHALGALEGRHRILMLPTGNMWDMRDALKLCDAVEKELPGKEIGGEYLTLGTLYRMMQRDGPIIGAIAFALVVLFTALDLRRLRPTLGALAVQIAGMAWWCALLAMFDIKISIVNFVGIPIVLGIGIDVMIHLIHRLNQEGPGSIVRSLSTTGWASALGTSTTVVAFAALSFGSSQGIRSLGLLVLLGESAVTIAGFLLVPLGFAWLWHREGHRPR